MDTNTLQILVTLMAQQKAVVIPGRSAIEITLLVLAALAPIILAFAGWIKAQSVQTDVKEVKTDLKDVKEKVNGALDQMKAQARDAGMLNGAAVERREQQKVKETIAAVKEAIAPAVSPPAMNLDQLEKVVDALKKLPPTL